MPTRRIKAISKVFEVSAVIWPAYSDTDISGEYEKAEQAEKLLNLILSLGEPDASIIIQKYYYDRNSVEIAKMTGLNPVAVRMRLSRALKRMRKLLEENP